MNFLSMADSAIAPGRPGWIRNWHNLDDPDGALRALLDAGWRATRAMKGMDVVASTTLLRDALQHRHRFRHAFPSDEVETLLALGSLWQDDIDAAMRHAQAVFARNGATRYRPALATVMKLAFWRRRDFMPFYALSRRKAHHGHPLSLLAAIVNLSIEAAAEAEQLRFKLAEHLAHDALLLCSQLAETESHASLLPNSVLAHLHYEAGAVDEADMLLRGRLATMEESGALESLLIAYPLSARIAAARGNQNLALLLLQRGEDIGLRQHWPRLVLQCKAEAAILCAQAARIDLAEAHMKQWLTFAAQGHFSHIDAWPVQVASLRMQIAANPGNDTIRALDELRHAALQHNHPALVVKLTILLAGAHHALNQATQANEALLAALHQGADTGLFRSFLDELPLIEPLLRQLWRSSESSSLGHLGAYIGRLLTAPRNHSPVRKKFRTNHRLVESLSARETIILRLMSLGLSNKSIARELQVTPETVKTHAKHIFIKLASKNRAEAVSRATELGLM